MNQGRLKELSTKFLELQTRKRQLEQQVEDLQAEMEHIRGELVPVLEELEAQNVKLEGIGTVYLQSRFYVRPVAEKLEELVAWLDGKGLSHLAKLTVHHKTLESEYRRWQEEDLPVPPSEMLQVFSKTEVRIRRGG